MHTFSSLGTLGDSGSPESAKCTLSATKGLNVLHHGGPEGHETFERAHEHDLGPWGPCIVAILLTPVVIAVGRDEHVLPHVPLLGLGFRV